MTTRMHKRIIIGMLMLAASAGIAVWALTHRADTYTRDNSQEPEQHPLPNLDFKHADYIEPQDLYDLFDNPDIAVIDIRNAWEWHQGHIAGAVLIPLSELPRRLNEVPTDKHIILYCRTANRTLQGLQILRQAGHPSVRHLRGGINAWSRAGHKVITSSRSVQHQPSSTIRPAPKQ